MRLTVARCIGRCERYRHRRGRRRAWRESRSVDAPWVWTPTALSAPFASRLEPGAGSLAHPCRARIRRRSRAFASLCARPVRKVWHRGNIGCRPLNRTVRPRSWEPAIPDPVASPTKKTPINQWEHRYLGEERFPETLSALEIEHFFTLDEGELGVSSGYV
jgi:hypothetical protein